VFLTNERQQVNKRVHATFNELMELNSHTKNYKALFDCVVLCF
jgi:hypothetical protein